MDNILKFYLSNKDWIDLIKDLLYFAGAWALVKIIINKRFIDKTRDIEENLKIREKLEPLLSSYVSERSQLGKKDISIRFVCWENYPWNLTDDGYKHPLHLRYFDNISNPFGFINNTGVNFQEHVWWVGNSVYVDKNNIFFFHAKSQKFQEFNEIKDCVMVFHLPYKNIINFDFREFIEHEPVFHIRYPYTKYRKLYDSQVIIREKLGDPYMHHELDLRYQLKKYTFIRYNTLKLKIQITSLFRKWTKKNPDG